MIMVGAVFLSEQESRLLADMLARIEFWDWKGCISCIHPDDNRTERMDLIRTILTEMIEAGMAPEWYTSQLSADTTGRPPIPPGEDA